MNTENDEDVLIDRIIVCLKRFYKFLYDITEQYLPWEKNNAAVRQIVGLQSAFKSANSRLPFRVFKVRDFQMWFAIVCPH